MHFRGLEIRPSSNPIPLSGSDNEKRLAERLLRTNSGGKEVPLATLFQGCAGGSAGVSDLSIRMRPQRTFGEFNIQVEE
jgi:hypothetical protein